MIEQLYLQSRRAAPKLRIGVMIDDTRLIGPFAAVLRHIAASNFAQLALVIEHVPANRRAARPTRSIPARALGVLRDPRRRAKLVYEIYLRWDEMRHAAAAQTLAAEDCSDLLRQVAKIEVAPDVNGFVHRFPKAALDAVRSHELDVILRFGFNILKGEVLSSARYGIWSYHHGDNDFYRGGPAVFWEVVEKQDVTGAVLQVLNEELDGGLVLAKTLAPTALGLSRTANLAAPYRAAQTMIIEKLHKLHSAGWDAVRQDCIAPTPYSGRRAMYRTPTNLEMAKWLFGRELPALAGRRLRRDGKVKHWRVAVRPRSTNAPWEGSWSDFNWLDAPKGHFFADPFVIEHDGRSWMFLEDYDYACGLGSICCAELSSGAGGVVGPWQTVLRQPYHLSFPFVFAYGGEMFMIPETQSRGRVELYRATRFPDEWELDHVLADLPGLDTVLHVGGDGIHYFFTTLRSHPDAHGHLFLFTAPGLREPWTLHPASPLSRDVRYARNAGPLLQQEGCLFRVSQDASGWYGRKMHFHRIERLTPTEYSESLVGSRYDEWGPDVAGTHTFACSQHWEVIDGQHRVPPASVGWQEPRISRPVALDEGEGRARQLERELR